MKTVTLLQTVSSNPSATTGSYDIGDLKDLSVQVVFTGSNVVGVFKLQASIDGTNYFDVPSSSQNITSSVGYLYSISNAGYRYIQGSWTYTSGTGNITVTLFLKDNVVKFA